MTNRETETDEIKASVERGPALYWGAVFAYAALIFVVSDQPFQLGPPSVYYGLELDKVAHLAEFGLFAILLCRAVRRTAVLSFRAVMLVSILIVSGYALTDEFHQGFVKYRSREALDVASDVVGAIIGTLVWRRYTKWAPSRRGS